ncbi:MAG: zf-HC2 domain-containing protein, partial [Chloroflexi bacterium]|nr:zf-HC2 domain-containing protein [Chloroflexota bacterium]
MSRHEVHFTNLVDWLDNRLDAETRRRVETHVASCPTCQRDLAWLQRVVQAARSDDMVEPPQEVVARAKALYRVKRAAAHAPLRVPRLAFTLALTLVLLISATVYLSQVPTLFAREATLAMVEGSVQVQRLGTEEWQAAGLGEALHEGDGIRVEDGTVTLARFEGSLLGMRAGSELTLSTMRSG